MVAWIWVECNEDSLSVAIPWKVKQCLQACAIPVIPPWGIWLLGGDWQDSERIAIAVLPKKLHKW